MGASPHARLLIEDQCLRLHCRLAKYECVGSASATGFLNGNDSIFCKLETGYLGVSTKSDRHAQTLPYARYAIAQIERLRLRADPDSFELWYRYAMGQSSELTKAVDDALSSPTGLTEQKFDNLCDLYVSSKRTGPRLSLVATDLSGEITQVMGMIGAAAASSETYEERLGEGLHRFKRTDSHDALKPVVEALVMATREMEGETRALQRQLEESKTKTVHLQQQIETLRIENLTDSLTLIGNRQYFDESLTRLVAAAADSGEPLSLLFCDIDHFKNFNDKFGHQVGDQVLRLVAGLIKNTLRDRDVFGRYGGEEFAIILPSTPLAVAKMAAERIRAAIMVREIKKRGTGGSFGSITISIGVAQLRDGETSLALLKRADGCLYAAKRSGRNRVVSESDPEVLTG
jgi:diguanylate cyclase